MYSTLGILQNSVSIDRGKLISEAEGDVAFDNKHQTQNSGFFRKIDSWVRDTKLARQTDFLPRDLTIFMSYTGPVHVPHDFLHLKNRNITFFVCSITRKEFFQQHYL